MASGLGIVYANKVLDLLMRGTALTPPSSYWVALFTTNIASVYLRADDIATAGEVTGGSYARVQVRSGSSIAWIVASAGHTENDTDISFPQATGSWGTVYASALMDASTAGHVVAYGDVVQSKAVTSPDIYKIPASFFGVNV